MRQEEEGPAKKMERGMKLKWNWILKEKLVRELV